MRKWVSGMIAVVLCVVAFSMVVQADSPAPRADQPGTPGRLAGLSVTGAKQGPIADSKSPIQVDGYSFQVQTAREAGSGQATGKRQYQPLLIRKRIDKASPLLAKAMVTNEVLTSVAMEVTTLGDGGVRVYTIRLENALLVDITQSMDEKGEPTESLSFTFQKIEWTYTNKDGKTMASDSWQEGR